MMFTACLLLCSLALFLNVDAQIAFCKTDTNQPTPYNVQTQRCSYSTSTGAWTVSNAAVMDPSGQGYNPTGSCGLLALQDPSSSSISYDKHFYDCCSDYQVNAMKYQVLNKYCCNGRRNGTKIGNAVLRNIVDEETRCCITTDYDTTAKHCCDGVLYDKIPYPDSQGWTCCGANMMDSDTHFCCNNKQYAIPEWPCGHPYRTTIQYDSCAWGGSVYDSCCTTLTSPILSGYLQYDMVTEWGHGPIVLSPKASRPAYC